MGNKSSRGDEESLTVSNRAGSNQGRDTLGNNTLEDDHEQDAYADRSGLFTADNPEDDNVHSNRCVTILKKIKKWILAENWLFLIMLGIVAALVGVGVDAGIYYLFQLQMMLVRLISNWGVQYLVWVAWCLIFSAFAILPIILISPHASGSGIPEMKCILSGIEMNRYLNFRTLVSKCIGLIMAYASGLSIGKEGPFVHIASILCSLLTKLPFFKYIRANNAAYMQVLSAASAVGVTSAFGTPVGGVFFSMEVTSTFYHVENLWRAFFVSIAARLISVVIRIWAPFGLDLFEVNWTFLPYTLYELVAFAIMGILLGILSGVFVKLLAFVFRLSRMLEFFQTSIGQLARAAFVCTVIGLVAFPFPLMRNDQSLVIDFLSKKSMSEDWGVLIALCIAKFVLTLFSVAFTGAAAGVFGPVFLEGAIMGRLFGELTSVMFPHLQISPGAYAIVGAAAFASGVTRTISTALIVVELTLQVQLLLPVLLAVLLANLFGRMISLSVYSVLIQAKDLPQMPRFKLFNQASSKTAGEIMRTDVEIIHTTATWAEIAKLVANSDYPSYPLVDEDGFFYGVVRRAKLSAALRNTGIRYHKHKLPIGQRVVNRVIKHWEEHNQITSESHSISRNLSRAHGGSTHLEPEDLETGPMSDRGTNRSFKSSGPVSIAMMIQDPTEGFGRKAIRARKLQALDVPPVAGHMAHDLAAPSGMPEEPSPLPLNPSTLVPNQLSDDASIDFSLQRLDVDEPDSRRSSSDSSRTDIEAYKNSATDESSASTSPSPVDKYSTMAPVDDDLVAQNEMSVLTSQVPFIFSTGNAVDKTVIDVDSSVLTIAPEASVTKVHFMFTVLGLSHLFVVRRGKLIGIITRKDLIKAINSMNFERR